MSTVADLKLIGVFLRITAAAVLVSCAGCSSYDREYQAGYDIDTHRYTAGVKIFPGTGKRSVSLNFTGYNSDLAPYFGGK